MENPDAGKPVGLLEETPDFASNTFGVEEKGNKVTVNTGVGCREINEDLLKTLGKHSEKHPFDCLLCARPRGGACKSLNYIKLNQLDQLNQP